MMSDRHSAFLSPHRERGSGGEDSTRAVYNAFTRRFPGRVRTCYAEGSLADGSRLATSDVDLVIVFADGFHDEEEHRQAEALAQSLNRDARVELDVTITDETALAHGVWPALKLASRLIAGVDMLPRFPLIAIDQWARERMHAAYWLTIKVHGRPEIVQLPLAYPDPTWDEPRHVCREPTHGTTSTHIGISARILP